MFDTGQETNVTIPTKENKTKTKGKETINEQQTQNKVDTNIVISIVNVTSTQAEQLGRFGVRLLELYTIFSICTYGHAPI
jgi:hypothetical protein